jgi:26S proteasome regulatory subunit N2
VLRLPLALRAQAQVYRYNIVSDLSSYYTQSLLQDAVEILEPMTKDSVDFVRQGAFIALGMILVEHSEASSPSLASTRARYTKVISDKHEDPMAQFSAAIGQGFIDAGGRNVTITLQSPAGSANRSAIVGMVLFCQFWYWYPLTQCACLLFSPTGIIGLNGDLKVIGSFPVFDLGTNSLLTGAQI